MVNVRSTDLPIFMTRMECMNSNGVRSIGRRQKRPIHIAYGRLSARRKRRREDKTKSRGKNSHKRWDIDDLGDELVIQRVVSRQLNCQLRVRQPLVFLYFELRLVHLDSNRLTLSASLIIIPVVWVHTLSPSKDAPDSVFAAERHNVKLAISVVSHRQLYNFQEKIMNQGVF